MICTSWAAKLSFYVVAVMVCKYVVPFAASDMANVFYWLKFPFAKSDSLSVLRFYTGNWLIFNVLAGLAFGASICSLWKSVANAFVSPTRWRMR